MNRYPEVDSWTRRVTEEPRVGPLGDDPEDPSPILWWANPEWETRFPRVVQGTTGRSPGEGEGDLGLFRESGSPAPERRWTRLARALGFPGIVHARQVHGRTVCCHHDAPSGLSLGPDADGHLTAHAGILMAVTVADCVPVFLVDARGTKGGVLHAGWRGVVEGILEKGVRTMVERMGSDPRDLHLHLGPSICGICYEVGPEVHEALGLEAPTGPQPVDLGRILEEQALGLGLEAEHITRSSHCTLCGGSHFFSHRGGDPRRQVGFLGFSLPSE